MEHKYKVGDRFRLIWASKGIPTGVILALVDNNNGSGPVYIVDYDNSFKSDTYGEYTYGGRKACGVAENFMELITEYQKITPKVGDKFRVVKECKSFAFHYMMKKGDEVEVDLYDGAHFRWKRNGVYFCYSSKDGLTTEYLEPVEEKVSSRTELKHGDILYTDRQTITAYRKGESPIEKELNKPKQSIMKTISNAVKKLLSADQQALYKVDTIGSDLELTSTGRADYVQALFNNDGDHKAAMKVMVASANERIEETK